MGKKGSYKKSGKGKRKVTWVTEIETTKIADGAISFSFDSNLLPEYRKKVKHKYYTGSPGTLVPIQWPDVKTAVDALSINEGITYWAPILPSPPETPPIVGATWDPSLPAWTQTKMTPPEIPSNLHNKFADVTKNAEKIRDDTDLPLVIDRFMALRNEGTLPDDPTWIELTASLEILVGLIYLPVIGGVGGLIDET